MSYRKAAFLVRFYVEHIKGKITIATQYYQCFTQKMHFVEHFRQACKNYLKSNNYYSAFAAFHP